ALDSGSIAGGWSLLIETATTTTLPSGTVEFAPGETTKEITVYVSGDTDLEGDEGFSVTLSDAVDAIINTDTAEGTILNDDSDVLPSTLDIAPLNAVQGEGDTGTTPFTFTVTRSGDTTGTSSVNWAVTLSGGADAADFGGTLPSGTVTFTPGETTKEITVYVNGDISYETDEGFSVTLSDAVDAIINTDTAEGIILNDDTAIDNAQKITSSSNISAAPGGTVTIPLYYDTTTGDNSLPGISLRLHYNSSELTFNNASDLFLTNLFGDVKDLPDNGNFDSDVITDRFLQLQYNDFTGNWPNQPLPLKLADFKFTTTDSFTGTQVNFSSSNTAAGYGLAANSVTVSQGWNLDIDGSGEIKALSDGVILMRHLFGSFIGNDLIDGAIDPNATRDLVAIQAYLQEGVNQGHLDIDGNGSVGAYSDGIMAVRYMFGTFPGDALIHEVLSPDATRDLAQIQNHLEQLTTLV
ncbi:Calx-beta domain-containing protein, partial [Umezakia ovalisporum]|uniref:Calx-beta domain-containing protein n=1 Tax=Umezakia ovalisporum TaxID=75695 RepID=UPI0035B7E493